MMSQITFSALRRVIKVNVRFASAKPKVTLDAHVEENLINNEFKPRKHPGVMRAKNVSLPNDIVEAIKYSLDNHSAKNILNEAIKLENILRSRHVPPEQNTIDEKAKNLYDKIVEREGNNVSEEDQEILNKLKKKREVKLFNLLKKHVYRWGSISYDSFTALQYLLIRAPAEYAVLYRIFDEIKNREPEFTPRSFFDFGSGVGTGTWAVRQLWTNIFEYFCVDTSLDMHDLARLVLCGGRDNAKMPIKSYYQRQFLPVSTDSKYDIVLCAYSLFELPSAKTRLQTIQTLWNKTNDFLVIVEYGSNAGFQLVNEARDFVLSMNKEYNKGHVFAPCPNDTTCPRYMEQKTPCNFLMRYSTLPIGQKSDFSADLFTYVVLRKGSRPVDQRNWPRIVRPPIVRSGHTICRMCTAKGELKEVIFTKTKPGKLGYRCARTSSWGDLLPVEISSSDGKNETISGNDEDTK